MTGDETPAMVVPVTAALAMALSVLPGSGFRSVTASYPLPVDIEGWDPGDARVTVTVSVGEIGEPS